MGEVVGHYDMFAQPFGKKCSWHYRMILFLVVQSVHTNVSITSGAAFPRRHIYCLITREVSRYSFSENMSWECFLPGGSHTSRAYGRKKLKATWAGRMESCDFQGAEVERNIKAFIREEPSCFWRPEYQIITMYISGILEDIIGGIDEVINSCIRRGDTYSPPSLSPDHLLV